MAVPCVLCLAIYAQRPEDDRDSSERFRDSQLHCALLGRRPWIFCQLGSSMGWTTFPGPLSLLLGLDQPASLRHRQPEASRGHTRRQTKQAMAHTAVRPHDTIGGTLPHDISLPHGFMFQPLARRSPTMHISHGIRIHLQRSELSRLELDQSQYDQRSRFLQLRLGGVGGCHWYPTQRSYQWALADVFVAWNCRWSRIFDSSGTGYG